MTKKNGTTTRKKPPEIDPAYNPDLMRDDKDLAEFSQMLTTEKLKLKRNSQ